MHLFTKLFYLNQFTLQVHVWLLPTAREHRCCHCYHEMQRFKENEVCITQTSGFESNCLNADVLETSIYYYFGVDGPRGDEETHSE